MNKGDETALRPLATCEKDPKDTGRLQSLAVRKVDRSKQ